DDGASSKKNPAEAGFELRVGGKARATGTATPGFGGVRRAVSDADGGRDGWIVPRVRRRWLWYCCDLMNNPAYYRRISKFNSWMWRLSVRQCELGVQVAEEGRRVEPGTGGLPDDLLGIMSMPGLVDVAPQPSQQAAEMAGANLLLQRLAAPVRL